MIAFLGSVFSPYYAWARRSWARGQGGGDPLRHCALNVALYGQGRRWAMTERGPRSVARGADFLSIGPSALSWDGSGLTVRIDEIGVPVPRRVRGTVRLYPSAVESRTLALDTAGRHRWRPIAPCARVEVMLDQPGLSWSGPAYFDTNSGDRPLEADFLRWDWSRAAVPGGTAVLYDVVRRDGALTLAMQYAAAGGVEDFAAPPPVALPRTRWRVPRRICAAAPRVTETLEDTPFYARSVVQADLLGQQVTAMHESLAMDRFSAPWVQAMLPFRMPRARSRSPAIGAGPIKATGAAEADEQDPCRNRR
ncbi:carotenoid 1,2-hydratase [Rhodopila sp.]|uniref:carotenoid 1,2-hydratase n=1 Tax=Rhodopila sp. TaxID=2480087 RepID=UPI003D09CE2E